MGVAVCCNDNNGAAGSWDEGKLKSAVLHVQFWGLSMQEAYKRLKTRTAEIFLHVWLASGNILQR
jgi:hypothetical protein